MRILARDAETRPNDESFTGNAIPLANRKFLIMINHNVWRSGLDEHIEVITDDKGYFELDDKYENCRLCASVRYDGWMSPYIIAKDGATLDINTQYIIRVKARRENEKEMHELIKKGKHTEFYELYNQVQKKNDEIESNYHCKFFKPKPNVIDAKNNDVPSFTPSFSFSRSEE